MKIPGDVNPLSGDGIFMYWWSGMANALAHSIRERGAAMT